MPAVMKTMSVSFISSPSSSRLSSAAGQLAADVDPGVSLAVAERLEIGVDGDELHALQVGGDHPVHRVAAAATGADDLDPRPPVLHLVPLAHVRLHCCKSELISVSTRRSHATTSPSSSKHS
jgi:hypothetical protein